VLYARYMHLPWFQFAAPGHCSVGCSHVVGSHLLPTGIACKKLRRPDPLHHINLLLLQKRVNLILIQVSIASLLGVLLALPVKPGVLIPAGGRQAWFLDVVQSCKKRSNN
jgi:hypothetical protein